MVVDTGTMEYGPNDVVRRQLKRTTSSKVCLEGVLGSLKQKRRLNINVSANTRGVTDSLFWVRGKR